MLVCRRSGFCMSAVTVAIQGCLSFSVGSSQMSNPGGTSTCSSQPGQSSNVCCRLLMLSSCTCAAKVNLLGRAGPSWGRPFCEGHIKVIGCSASISCGMHAVVARSGQVSWSGREVPRGSEGESPPWYDTSVVLYHRGSTTVVL
jgi:hypothetical protein